MRKKDIRENLERIHYTFIAAICFIQRRLRVKFLISNFYATKTEADRQIN